MYFAHPLPLWGGALLAIAVIVFALRAYHHTPVPLTRARHALLVALRAATLALLVLFWLRPIVLLPPAGSRGAVVAVLVDASRSMRLADANGEPRIARATRLLRARLLPELSRRFKVDLFAIGDGVAPVRADGVDGLDGIEATAGRSEIAAAVATVRQRYRGERLGGIVLLSDGGDTGRSVPEGTPAGAPIVAIGVGAPDGPADREVLGLAAADPRLDQAALELRVSAVSHGLGRAPFSLRVIVDGHVLEDRRIVPPMDGVPLDEVFTVYPDPLAPTVFTAEIPPEEREAVPENNARSILVSPAGRKRPLLVVEGAPGFEHTFMKRALARDPGLELDAVVRKGKNAEAQDTFFVQAAAGRAPSLIKGFPDTREALFAYDGIVLANIEGDALTRAQLSLVTQFVSERGGGLLVLGGRSFATRGLIGTPVEAALPVELNDRRGGTVSASLDGAQHATRNKLVVTPEGDVHPIMRIGATLDDSRRLWAALPPLAANAPVGGPRPGATVLAVSEAAGGGLHPVVAVQRFGRGRSMVFAGEASWRWRMMIASTDRTHEFFWRLAARWLAGPSPDQVTLTVPESPEPGDNVTLAVEARDRGFNVVSGAEIAATLTGPSGETREVKLRPGAPDEGRYSATVHLDEPGLYRVRAEATSGGAALGAAESWMNVGGSGREFVEPRLNEGWLRRLARASGGRYVREADASGIAAFLQEASPAQASPERRDVWHEPWGYALVLSLLAAEWILRRRWGLR